MKRSLFVTFLFALVAGVVWAEKPVLRLAVMSDIQGYPYPEDAGMRNLERALDVLAPFKPDVVLNVGDINDGGRDVDAVKYYKARCDARFGKIPHVACLGNHEIGFIPKEEQAVRTPQRCIADFNAVFGEGPSPLVHCTIGGYDFIALSIERIEGFTSAGLKLLESALEKAVKRDATKPIFVLTHYHPYDTVNDSKNAKYDGGLRAILDRYPQVVNFSGHTHNPLQDPRSIWQGSFTVVDTSTLCYGCLETNPAMVNQISCLIPYGHEAVGCMLVEVYAKKIVMRRFAVRDRSEIEPKTPWSFDLPYDPKHPKYDFASRAKAAPEPRFPTEVEPTLWYDYGFIYVLFNAVENREDVFSYRLEFTDQKGKKTQTDFLSDYYRTPSHRQIRHCVRLSSAIVREGNTYRCRIIPVGFFGKEGRACEWTFSIKSTYPVSPTRANCVQE